MKKKDLQDKLAQLRKDYIKYPHKREIIKRQGLALKRALEIHEIME